MSKKKSVPVTEELLRALLTEAEFARELLRDRICQEREYKDRDDLIEDSMVLRETMRNIRHGRHALAAMLGLQPNGEAHARKT